MVKYLLLAFLLFSTSSFSQTLQVNCEVCTTHQEQKEVLERLEELLTINEELSLKLEQLQRIREATPQLKLKPLRIVVDKEGRVFISDHLTGKLEIADLSYNILTKVPVTIIKQKETEWGLGLQPKFVFLVSYELDDERNLRPYETFGLGVEIFYYKQYELDFVIGPRLYGPMIGLEITEHFSALTGVGLLYNGEQSFILGAGFDF